MRDVQCCLQVSDTPQDLPDIMGCPEQSGHNGMSRLWSLSVRRFPQGTSQDSPGMSLKTGVTWCPEDFTWDIPGQSWDVPQDWCDLVSGGFHMGHPRTVLHCKK